MLHFPFRWRFWFFLRSGIVVDFFQFVRWLAVDLCVHFILMCVCMSVYVVLCPHMLHVFGNVLALDLSYAVECAHVHTIIHLNVSILYVWSI